MKAISPTLLRILLIGLCAVFTISSAFAEGSAFIALIATALGFVIALRLTNLRGYPPATRLALTCLLCAIFVISGWKKHWVGFAVVAFAVCTVLIVRESLALIRARPVLNEGISAGGSGPQDRK